MLMLGTLILPVSRLMYVLTEYVSCHSPQNFIAVVAKITDISIQSLPLYNYGYVSVITKKQILYK